MLPPEDLISSDFFFLLFFRWKKTLVLSVADLLQSMVLQGRCLIEVQCRTCWSITWIAHASPEHHQFLDALNPYWLQVSAGLVYFSVIDDQNSESILITSFSQHTTHPSCVVPFHLYSHFLLLLLGLYAVSFANTWRRMLYSVNVQFVSRECREDKSHSISLLLFVFLPQSFTQAK